MRRAPTSSSADGELRSGGRGRAVVVGAGIAGLAMAHALGCLGYEVRVLERGAALADEGAGLTLWPNATAALRSLGLEHALAGRALELSEAMTMAPDGRTLATLPLARIKQRFGALMSIHRGELLAALHEGLGDRIEYDTPASLKDGRLWAGGEPVEADLTVGADGIGSVTRGLVAGDVRPRAAGYGAWRGIAASGAGTPRAASETLGRGRRFGLVPLADERTYWFAVIAGDDGAADLADEFAGWHEPIAAVLARTPAAHRSYLPLADLPPLARWHRGCVVLVGDAAHAMTPNLGQGAAQALQDVAALAARLRTDPVPAALAAYVTERKRASERVVARSRAAGRLAQASSPVRARLRNALVRGMPDAAVLRQLGGVLNC